MYSKKFKNKMHVLIVNHNIRKESYIEAIKVKKILLKKKIKCRILVWKGKVPKSNIQGKARDLRYQLLANYCSLKKIKYLITAHHKDDQIENFYIRLLRGSGVTGLSSMSEIINYDKNLKILRPLLRIKKKELKHVTSNYFGTYIKDPSNEDKKFLRVRIRQFRKDMEKEGFDDTKIIKTIDNLLSAKKAIDFYKDKALYKHVTFLSKNNCVVNAKIFSEESKEIIFKSFSDILSLISGTYYPPRSIKVLNLINRIKKMKYNKSTLGGCIIEKKEDFISISKEKKSKLLITIGK
jgi:tRNA(Ile)-lysidine synthase